MMKISNICNNISFIIQGVILPDINDQIASIKKHFPDSKIIVSTCNNFDFEVIGADKVIVSDDPGFFYYSDRPGEKKNNINRQIVSTLAGLKACTTEYAFKIRSDFILNGNDFLKYFNTFSLSDSCYRIFGHKVLSCCYFARNPRSNMPFPFHPSDIAFFGKVDDLINLFDIPLMTEKEAFWDTTNKRFNRYVPEQHLLIKCLEKNNRDIKCNHYNDVSQYNIEETERYFASNFIFLTFEQFNLVPTKSTFFVEDHPDSFLSCYTHVGWMKLYKEYVDHQINVPEFDEEKARIKKLYKKYKKYRFISNICALPFRNKAKRRDIRNKILEYFLNK